MSTKTLVPTLVRLTLLVALVLLVAPAVPAQAFLSLVRQGAESADVPNTNDRFGRTVCAGDFDGDGFEDLATAAPDESNGLINTAVHGMVIISRGTARGISSEGARSISIGDLGTEAARFGASLASGDFDQDGFDDLAVGIPQLNTISGSDRGAVFVYAGGPSGLQLAPYLQILFDDVNASSEEWTNFGWALAVGDFDDDGYPDLVTSAIGHNSDTGTLYSFFGSAGGLTKSGFQTMFPYTAGGSSAQGGHFGYALAAGQLDGIGGDDLVVGAPQTNVLGQAAAGRVYFYYAGASGITGTGAWYRDASNLEPGLETSGNAHLGFSVAVGHMYQVSGQVDVAVGAPRNDYGDQAEAGAVYLFEFDGLPRAYDSAKILRQHAQTNSTSASPGDQFGYAVAVGRFDIGNYEDLAIGAPFEDVTEQSALGEQFSAGVFHILYGKAGGPSMFESETFDSADLNNFVDGGDQLGQALCFGRFDSSSRESLAVGAPGADYDSYEAGGTNVSNAGQVHIFAPWRQPTGHPHRSSVLLDCDGFILYGQRPFQRVRPASTTKTMTLLLACDAIWNGDVDPQQFYTVPGWVADQVGGSQTPLVEGEKLSFVGLMQTMMAVSGNDSAMLIGSILSGDGGPWEGWEDTSPAFAQMLETRASQLGLSGATSLTNAAGIDAGDHYVTALDWATLAYLAIQHECVETIVNTSPWIVERVLPAGSSLDFFQFGGGGGDGTISVFEAFFASWVDGVKARYPEAKGIKPGGTPGAWSTGLSAAEPFGNGFSAASTFGTRRDDAPVEGVDAGCSTCLNADLLQFAEGYCPGGAPNDFAPTPDPGPRPWGTITSIPPCPDDGVRAMTLNLGDEQIVPPGRVVQFDVMRSGHTAGSLPVRQMISRTSQIVFEDYELVPFGIAPHQGNLGLEILNEALEPATFEVLWNGVPLTFALAPNERVVVPGVSQPSASFDFHIRSLQRNALQLAVSEVGYTFEVALGDGITSSDAHSVRLVRAGHLLTESVSARVQGRGDDCGDDTLDLVARADDGIPTSVDDGFLPPAPARSRLLPSYPNPFNPSTTIRFDLPHASTVELAIFDQRGRRVKSFACGESFGPGRHQVQWHGTDDAGASVASGVYTLRLVSEGAMEVQRMTLLK